MQTIELQIIERFQAWAKISLKALSLELISSGALQFIYAKISYAHTSDTKYLVFFLLLTII